MKKLYFRASLDINDYYKHNVKRSDNLAVFRYGADWSSLVQPWLMGLVDASDKRLANGKQPIELEITVKAHYDDRSVEANALMWVIYDVKCEILNHEMQNIRNRITPMELYTQDMKDYAPHHVKIVPQEFVSAIIAYAELGEGDIKGHLESKFINADGTVTITIIESSSFWDSVFFATFIEYQLAELQEMGRTRFNDGFVKGLIDDFNEKIKKEGKK